MIWKEKKVWLIAIGVLLLANLAFFFTYRIRYEERVEALNHDLGTAQSKLAAARQRRATAEADFATYKHAVTDIDTVYNDLWSTRDKRLTSTITTIKKLGDRCGLEPTSFSYTWTPAKKELAIESMGISFTVKGSYEQIRKLVNLIEVSPEFLIIDQVSVGGAEEKTNELQLSIRVRTLFKETPGSGAIL